MIKVFKFAVFDGIGAGLVFLLTYLLTEAVGLYYLLSLLLACIPGVLLKFYLNNKFTFTALVDPYSPGYEWDAWYSGNPVQRWWKKSIARKSLAYTGGGSKTVMVGCGSSPMISDYPGAVCVDIDSGKLGFIRDKFDCSPILADAHYLPFKYDSVDKVLLIEVLEHLGNPEWAFSQSSRILRDDGVCVIATPDSSGISGFIWNIFERFTPYKDDHVSLVNREVVESWGLKYGMVAEEYSHVAFCDLVEKFRKGVKL